MALAASLMALASAVYAADDTSRFNGTWQATFRYNGQMMTLVSVHDGHSYRNSWSAPTGDTPAGEGQFSAANGVWTSSAEAPNNYGTYQFLGADTVVCKNAVGQVLTWKRVKTPATQQPSAASEPVADTPSPDAMVIDPSLPADTQAAIKAFNHKDYPTAWHNFMASAQRGDAEAQAGVGAMLFKHLNPPGTGYYAQCEKWLLLSANQGNTKGMSFLAQYYYASGVSIAGGINPGVNNTPIPAAERQQAESRFKLSRQWFERAAAKNDIYAMGNLAILLDAGIGGPVDHDRAAQLRAQLSGNSDRNFVRRATADPGNQALTAAWQAGHYADALRDAQARAAKGDANAQALLGRAYYEGVGVTRDYSAALRWLNAAVAQNNADAMFFLGLMYEHGRGVQQDIPRSVDLFDRAAALGQGYARMEAKGMRLQGESNRIAALARRNSSTEDIACSTAGGVSVPGACLRGGETIDPFNFAANEHN
jgi:TPR repeat protein